MSRRGEPRSAEQAARDRERVLRLRSERRAAGLCPSCGDPADRLPIEACSVCARTARWKRLIRLGREAECR